jgi:hypothetical protein
MAHYFFWHEGFSYFMSNCATRLNILFLLTAEPAEMLNKNLGHACLKPRKKCAAESGAVHLKIRWAFPGEVK